MSKQKSRRDVRALLKVARLWRDRRRLVGSGLFDARWYREATDVPQGVDPALHYLLHGARRGLKPHPLFDTKWYQDQYPDIGVVDPVLHYLLHGAHEGRDPNPFFSSSWYVAAYPDVAQGGANPLAHYIRHGMQEGRRPSVRFDPTFYRRHFDEGHAALREPLIHFLSIGQSEGLRPVAQLLDQRGEPVEWAAIDTKKAWHGPYDRDVALFVTHAPAGHIKRHVPFYLDALSEEDISVILVVAAGAPVEIDTVVDLVDGLYVRDNVGYDFAAWSHLLKLNPMLWDAPNLYLLNDSVVGPTSRNKFRKILSDIHRCDSDVVSLTESRERNWHLQSYFLVLKTTALMNARLQSFFNSVRNLTDKQDVIDQYEVAFASHALDAGLTVKALFSSSDKENPTLFAWEALLNAGFPFLKMSVIAGRFDAVDAGGWRERISADGFDPSLADDARSSELDRTPPYEPTTLPPWLPAKIAFFGPWNYANGLGEASRGYLSALWRLERPLNLHGLKLPFHTHRRLAPGYDICDFIQPADAVIVHLNPDGWHLLTDEQRHEIQRARLRIGIWVWEMSHVPEFFRPNFDNVDVIWTPSRYCADVFSRETDRPVHVVPHAIAIPPLPEPRLIGRNILYVFDGSSYLIRKNPTALVRAFAMSKLAGSGWTLTLKSKNLSENPVEAALLGTLCEETQGVNLIDQPLSQEEMARLFADADIYASPHASEGFGLTIAEAMAAGKIVVATDHGGSTDFLDDSTGFPVPFELVTLDRDYGHYRKGGRWASVSVQALSEALSRAAVMLENGDFEMGLRARARISTCLSSDKVAKAMQDSLEALIPLAGDIEMRRK